jgi:hypothetical protein
MAVYWLRIALFACLVFQVLARSLAGSPTQMIVKETELLQNIVRFIFMVMSYYCLLICKGNMGRTVAVCPWQADHVLQWRVPSMEVRFQPFFQITSDLIETSRLPVPGLWLDVFQKIRSMGYTGVSFYVHWALLEGKPGDFSAEGVFAYEPFFEAATKAGIYLLAVWPCTDSFSVK